MNDFLNGWSQGMTGSTGGQPSQSVLEAMGRDAARKQWSNNNNQVSNSAGGGYGIERDGIPVTTLLYQAGQKMRFKKLARDFVIAIVLTTVGTLMNQMQLFSLDWGTILFLVPGWILLFWTLLRVPFYLIAKAGSLIKGKPKDTAEEKPS